MSQHLIDGLRRRLVPADGADSDAPPSDRRAGASRRTSDGSAATGVALADGGRRSDDEEDDAHLRDLPDGAGCTEIWEHLSERQAERRGDDPRAGECQADD